MESICYNSVMMACQETRITELTIGSESQTAHTAMKTITENVPSHQLLVRRQAKCLTALQAHWPYVLNSSKYADGLNLHNCA